MTLLLFFRTVLKDGILLIMKSVVIGKFKDPSWLFLVPLLHILNGDCKPYELPQKAAGHEDVKPVWWGIAQFEAMVTGFKRRYGTWTMYALNLFSFVTVNPYHVEYSYIRHSYPVVIHLTCRIPIKSMHL